MPAAGEHYLWVGELGRRARLHGPAPGHPERADHRQAERRERERTGNRGGHLFPRAGPLRGDRGYSGRLDLRRLDERQCGRAGLGSKRDRAIWQMGQVQVFDGGASGTAGAADATLFEDEGVYVP